MTPDLHTVAERAHGHSHAPSRPFVAVVAFLTLVDLFATQALTPTLARAYGVSPAEAGVAVNACTFGMAAASLGVALFARGVDRRKGVALALALLAVPTALLGVAPDLETFAALRVAQGLCMATAFTLTLAALGEVLSGKAAAAAAAAYVTGNVASNLVGRLMAAGAAAEIGLGGAFLLFAALNLAGAALVYWSHVEAPGDHASGVGKGMGSMGMGSMGGVHHGLAAPWTAVRRHFATPGLPAAFALGFALLFAFIGVFTYVNFVLVAPEVGLGAMSLGLVYFVFAPSILTTPLAGRVSARLGARAAVLIGLSVAALGLIGLVSGELTGILAGMALTAIGTFFAQGVATGYVGRAAREDRSAASGLYLASYFSGGLVGSVALGAVFERVGWEGCVAGVGVALAVGALLALGLREPEAPTA